MAWLRPNVHEKGSLRESRQLLIEATGKPLADVVVVVEVDVVAATLVHADDEIMLITDRGVLVRTRVSEIRELGRATQGVTLISLDEGSQLSGLQRIVENDAAAPADDEAGEGDAAPQE